MTSREISVLVVDDSAFICKALSRMIEAEPGMTVAGQARDGEEAIEMVERLTPDVITLDIKMPGMDGLKALGRIMNLRPTPVLIVSSLTREGGEITLKALEIGAVDFIDKSTCQSMMNIMDISELLVKKIWAISGVNVARMKESIIEIPSWMSSDSEATKTSGFEPRKSIEKPSTIVAIGASTGGPVSIEAALRSIPKDYTGAIIVVQHLPVGFSGPLSERLNRNCDLSIVEAQEGEAISAGTVYIAPGGTQIQFRFQNDRLVVGLVECDGKYGVHCPSTDGMMESLAANWPGPLVGIVMTGMGTDGEKGIGFIKNRGGKTYAQDEATSVVFGMPKAAYQSGNVDRLLPLDEIPGAIIRAEV